MKRFRIFAGPNGSGKSTIINNVRNTLVSGYPIDFGLYVNADEIALCLAGGTFTFTTYELGGITVQQLQNYGATSGLFRHNFTADILQEAINIDGDLLLLNNTLYKESVAQLLSNFLVDKLLQAGKKCSMETVFSHESKVRFMEQAVALGYKVYLYFVATADADINVARVKYRVDNRGHDVPEASIRERYTRSLNLMYDAAQIAYQAYFFDNSGAHGDHKVVAHFKVVKGQKKWDRYKPKDLTDWFVEYYVNKQ